MKYITKVDLYNDYKMVTFYRETANSEPVAKLVGFIDNSNNFVATDTMPPEHEIADLELMHVLAAASLLQHSCKLTPSGLYFSSIHMGIAIKDYVKNISLCGDMIEFSINDIICNNEVTLNIDMVDNLFKSLYNKLKEDTATTDICKIYFKSDIGTRLAIVGILLRETSNSRESAVIASIGHLSNIYK